MGLLSPARRDPVADYAENPFKGRKLVVWNMMGYAAFIAPRETHVIDLYGLGDPILARLPNRLRVAAGHYRRAIPDGYLRTLATGKNAITDPSLRAYQDRLHLVQAGPIWSPERLRAVLGFLIGEYNGLLADYIKNHRPGYKRVDLNSLSSPVPDGTAWDDDRVETIDYDGLRISLPQPSHARRAKIVLDGNDQYAVAFVRAAELDAPGFQPTPMLLPATNDARGLLAREVEIPEGTARAGFDVVLVVPVTGDNIFAIGGLTFTD